MAKQNFTAGLVSKARCESGKLQSIFWDAKTPGLGLRVTTVGAKSFIFETRLHGKTLRVTIGDVRTWPVGKAQAEATRLKALTDQGVDPRQIKADIAAASEAKREQTRCAEALALDVWQIYVEARTPRWSARSPIDHQKLVAAGRRARATQRYPASCARCCCCHWQRLMLTMYGHG